ncbi:MAG: vitamin B12-dependent ribonucleotide reductase, partial [Acidimicrobiales bacterium]
MAIAPQRATIGIRRHFTIEGVHPYDEIRWERRDARITNFRDGSVAFEQPGVEVPEGWSLNATNILAQKYFRGTLGTPEREWSLKQVTDRVVDTITGWGIRDGYFVDDVEARVFSDELKHLIVHQKAAFNSPVWFNIGVRGVPQQGSACFILAVEDSMDSILNWYTEEGTIFKGGSGAGVNLSRIRSSHELLKGGGTASGPVSFMRGADASAGTIKSGGKTRRAAKMVILDADHPDIEDFIWCKAIEERKARVLRDAGFDMDLDGADSHSTQYQNANNSVRVTDEFMQAVLDDADWKLTARTDGSVIRTVKARDLFRQIAHAAWECADPGMQFDTTINKWHTAPNTGRINGSNPCSEYMHLDNSACNLASLNLLRYLGEDGSFDVDGFRAAVGVVFTAQEIIVGNADYPTKTIAENSRRFRELGIGYANLGALLMANGLPYDSDAGRAWAGAITALMTGHAYAVSARTAARMGPFAGFHDNTGPMVDVLRMHQAEAARIDEELVPPELLSAAQESWDEAVELAERHGVRNSQASVLAPTGCLAGGTLVSTGRGLVRLHSLGDPDGEKWQELGVAVATDEGPRPATKFFVNGLEPVVTAETAGGHRVRGTATHRIKVVEPETGHWVWRRFADLRKGDLVPLALASMIGEPQEVALPPSAEAYRTGEHHVHVPAHMTAELAELVGYFMGDGSLDSRGLTFRVFSDDFDVVERLGALSKECFGIPGKATPEQGYVEVRLDSVRLALWWEACGFAQRPCFQGHSGKGYEAHIPDAVLHANDPEVYAAFSRGLFEADGGTSAGCPTLKSTSVQMVRDVQTMLLALGFPTTLSVKEGDGESVGTPLAALRLLNASYNREWLSRIGFMSGRKRATVHVAERSQAQAGRMDDVPLTREMVDRLAPADDRLRTVLLMELRRGRVGRRVATELHERSRDPQLGHLLGFFYDVVSSAELTGEELTYDLSVPDNVTYVANGFVSHNTIGLLMDCDTTGVEPDLGLVKTKKLVGGGTMSIVNRTVPRALRQLGYTDEQVAEIVAYIDEHKTIVGSPHLAAGHLAVFACSMGDNTIHYSGHVRMMGAVQPFISGAISKCVAGDTLVPTEDGLVRIGSLYEGEEPDSFRPERVVVASLEGWQKIDAFYYGGERPVRSVSLRSGHRVTGTPNHRLLVGDVGGPAWKRLDEIQVGDEVAVQYGADLWAKLPPRIAFPARPRYGSQQSVRVPAELTEDLAFLLGAYASEGCTIRSVWSIRITNSVDRVLERVVAAVDRAFDGTVRAHIRRPVDRCPSVEINSKTVVELFELLGCGARASTKRIPDLVLRAPRSQVLAFLQGLALDAYTTAPPMAKWAICLDSPAMVDDLQALLTNLGVVHGRVTKHNKTNGKDYDEVYACGLHAQALVKLVPFLEPDKAVSADRLLGRNFAQSTADVVPGISGRELYGLVPGERKARYRFLLDERTKQVSRRTLERIAAIEGVALPSWLRAVLADGLHFSPVVQSESAGRRVVYDLSVPATHAFVGNGIVNHNTVNMPEDVSVDDVEKLHVDAWRLGIKAVAIYRDNCKVAQPLSTTKKEPAAVPVLGGDTASPGSEAEAKDRQVTARIAELEAALAHEQQRTTEAVVVGAVRERLPRRRRSNTFAFRVADCEGYVTVGEYEDGRPGEVFVKVSKQGSTLAGIMDAFSISISLGLQHGVPLATYVRKYSSMKFEPAGITDDAELRIATSLVDYIFRRLALDYLTYEERSELGVMSTSERLQPTLPGVEESATPSVGLVEIGPMADVDPPAAERRGRGTGAAVPGTQLGVPAAAPGTLARPEQRDAPYCYSCGNVMQRSGSCYVCPSCGST